MEVERLQAEYDIEVRFAPYLLDPTTPPEGKPRQRQTSPDSPPTDMELRGQAIGITYSRGRTITSNSHLAHEAAEFAAETPFAMAFQQRMFKAYFTELEDIGRLDTVVRLGVEIGGGEPEGAPGLGDGRPPAAGDEPFQTEAAILPGRGNGQEGGQESPEPERAAHRGPWDGGAGLSLS